jgi:hypothetical protein
VGGDLEQIQLLLGHASVQTTERYLGTQQNLALATMRSGWKWNERRSCGRMLLKGSAGIRAEICFTGQFFGVIRVRNRSKTA